MARCSNCAVETQLYVNGTPLCIACSERSQASRKPPQAAADSAALPNVALNVARDAYRRALQAQLEASGFKQSLGSDDPDGITALQNANRQLELASAKYEEALREFIAKTGMRRRSG